MHSICLPLNGIIFCSGEKRKASSALCLEYAENSNRNSHEVWMYEQLQSRFIELGLSPSQKYLTYTEKASATVQVIAIFTVAMRAGQCAGSFRFVPTVKSGFCC